jgi:formate hydrogenlyase transcriptional activator
MQSEDSDRAGVPPGHIAEPGAFADMEQLLFTFFGASTVGLAICDGQLRYKAVNNALAAMNGIPADAHLGRTVHEILGEAAHEIELLFRQVFFTGQPLYNVELALKLPTRAEVGHWVENYFPIKDASGNVRQVGVVVVEITRQKKLEEETQRLNHSLQEERERLQALLEVSSVLASRNDLRESFPAISTLIRGVVKQDYASIAVIDQASRVVRMHALDVADAIREPGAETTVPIDDTVTMTRAFLDREVKILEFKDLEGTRSKYARDMLEEGFRSFCSIPLLTPRGPLGTLNLASKKEHAFANQDLGFLQQVAAQIATGLDNARAYQEIAGLALKLHQEVVSLQDEIRGAGDFEEIVGESPALKQVLSQVHIVAPSDATVLILGETGTGKELIARAIHRLSSRKDAGFVKLNCAAIPTGLLESELFGHEKGAFTGAISQKIGRLELADGGTLFLDEVGDIPLELQPKLLRVLQDQEFERLGGIRTIRVNVRLVAATNLDLAKRVAEHEFRNDLYYRLHVFPIVMPPLRERQTDIPLLVRYFVQRFSTRMHKQIENIPTDAMNALIHWEWPGNIRELENFIERCVILTSGETLSAPLAEVKSVLHIEPPNTTLVGVEREHIVRVLREAGGVIAGLNGAAARLGMKRTTLQSKMQRLKISRREIEN